MLAPYTTDFGRKVIQTSEVEIPVRLKGEIINIVHKLLCLYISSDLKTAECLSKH